MLTLIRRSFGRTAKSFVAIVAILAGFQAAVVAAAASIAADGGFATLAGAVPGFVQAGLGPALVSFAGMTTLGYFDPPIVLLVVQFAIYVASEPAGDVEAGLVDLILARPLPRHWIIGRSLVLVTLLLLLIVAAMGASTWISLRLLAPPDVVWPSGRTIVLMMAHLVAIAWCFGCVALAAAALTKRRSSAVGIVALLSVSLFLLDILVEFSATFNRFWWMTPFHYFHGAAVLTGNTDPVRNLTVLGGIGVIAAATAFWQFDRRDL